VDADINAMLAPAAGENHEYSVKIKDFSALAPLGERGDRKAVGEGVWTKKDTTRGKQEEQGKRQK
jgi:hypothetical protein